MMKIAGIVILCHFALVATLIYFHPPQVKLKPRKPVAVQTYVVQEDKPKPEPATPEPIVEAKPEPTVEEKPKPVIEAKPKPVVEEKKPPPPAKPKPKPVAKETKPVDSNREKLAQMMQQTLSNLNKSTSKPTPSSSAPKSIGPLSSEAIRLEAAYQDQLIAFLETKLTLPEKGDVKLTLTVNRNGTVKSATVKQTVSERNRKYVESTLPSLLLPSFENNFKGENAHTFSITLTSS